MPSTARPRKQDTKRRGWRLRFSLRSMFVATFVVAVACSWIAWRLDLAAKHQKAVETIFEGGGGVLLEPQQIGFVRKVLGNYSTYVQIRYNGDSYAFDQEFVCLSELNHVEKLYLYDIPLKCKHLKEIEPLRDLYFLNLRQSNFSNECLESVGKLNRLTELDFFHTPINDHGLIYLAELDNLETLNLTDTAVSDEGLKPLFGLTRLQFVSVFNTNVTAEGVKMLGQHLPNAYVFHESTRDD